MTVPTDLPPALRALLDRLRAMPVDRAPLRRAGLLALALLALVIGMPLLMPVRPVPAPPGDRQPVQGATEGVSAPAPRSGGSAGRVVALLLLAGAAAGAVALRRRAAAGPAPDTTLDVLESITIGPAQSLRLVAVGGEVLLLSVGADGARMLRHWPRATFDRRAVSLHDALALDAADHAAPDAAPPEASPSQPEPAVTPFLHEPEAATETRLDAPSVPPRGVLFPPPALPAQFLVEPDGGAPQEASFASVLRQFQTEDA